MDLLRGFFVFWFFFWSSTPPSTYSHLIYFFPMHKNCVSFKFLYFPPLIFGLPLCLLQSLSSPLFYLFPPHCLHLFIMEKVIDSIITCLSVSFSLSLPLYLSTYLSISLSLPLYLSTYLSISLSLHIPPSPIQKTIIFKV